MSLLPPGYGPDWLNQGSRLTSLRDLGFQPSAILDIGAYHGHFAGLARHIWPRAELLLIEANEDCAPILMEKGYPFVTALLDSKEGVADYHKCTSGCGEGNGLFKENSEAPFEIIKQRTRALDEVVGKRVFDFVKLDCQGAEIDVLEGGWDVMRGAHLIQLETQIQDYNEGAPRLDDVLRYMTNRGFRLFDIADFHHNSRKLLIQADLLFAKQDSPLFQILPLS